MSIEEKHYWSRRIADSASQLNQPDFVSCLLQSSDTKLEFSHDDSRSVLPFEIQRLDCSFLPLVAQRHMALMNSETRHTYYKWTECITCDASLIGRCPCKQCRLDPGLLTGTFATILAKR